MTSIAGPAPGRCRGGGGVGKGHPEREVQTSRDSKSAPGGVGPGRRAHLRGRATERLKAVPSPGHFSRRLRACSHAVMAWSPLLPFLSVLLLLLQAPAAAHASPLGTLPEGAAPCKVGTATLRVGGRGPAPRTGVSYPQTCPGQPGVWREHAPSVRKPPIYGYPRQCGHTLGVLSLSHLRLRTPAVPTRSPPAPLQGA